MKITVTSDNGHKVQLSTHVAVDGPTLVKATAFWRGRAMPAIELKAFAGDGADVRATRYVRRLAAALVDRVRQAVREEAEWWFKIDQSSYALAQKEARLAFHRAAARASEEPKR